MLGSGEIFLPKEGPLAAIEERTEARRLAELHDRELNFPVLVCGNGPSLTEQDDLVILEFQEWGSVIGCNSFWKLPVSMPDYLVCYDTQQLIFAAEGTSIPKLFTPDRKGTGRIQGMELGESFETLYARHLHRVHLFPLRSPVMPERGFEWPGWRPRRDGFMGNLSGLMAFQLAIALGAGSVFLLGMDVGGIHAHGGVRLSACDPGWNGYANHKLGEQFCEEVGGVPVPRGWRDKLKFWRALTDWSTQQGTAVYRLQDTGAMTWLPVRTPDAESNPHERVPSYCRR